MMDDHHHPKVEEERAKQKEKEDGSRMKPRWWNSADGPDEATTRPPKHPSPPSTGDRDLDITGQTYIQ
ncbi:unnamed protein product [Prunus armeniaca]|uniref:Uncharacterized protein n=1 Tax=Prunus armeniaca TaxID=36596 RepID=A0A6J5WCK7_PRUAR|nr:unnamed protein product [Prunus armeniaca]